MLSTHLLEHLHELKMFLHSTFCGMKAENGQIPIYMEILIWQYSVEIDQGHVADFYNYMETWLKKIILKKVKLIR